MKPPISTNWQNLTLKQAWILLIAGLILELPIRWIVRPDMLHLYPDTFWFNLPLRLAIEIGFVLYVLAVAWIAKIKLPFIGVPFRRWTKWEWIALAIVGTIEMIVVISIAGHRWPKIFASGWGAEGVGRMIEEFFFGFNQEAGFRCLMMTGLLRLKGFYWATAINTLLFLIGPLHGPGLIEISGRNLAGAIFEMLGIVVTGLFFSWLRYRSDNSLLVCILHGIVNGFLNGSGLTLRAHR